MSEITKSEAGWFILNEDGKLWTVELFSRRESAWVKLINSFQHSSGVPDSFSIVSGMMEYQLAVDETP